jgi:outer membrane protein
MRHFQFPPRYRAILLGFLLAFPPVGSPAQEARQERPVSPPGNFYERMKNYYYSVPEVRALELKADDSLESMIKDGKLQLTVEDAVRLALENNLDINVERYNPYFNVWGVEKGRAILNPFLSFSTNLNRNATPATSALQGSAVQLVVANNYSLDYHKPFESGLDMDVTYTTVRTRSSSFFTSVNPSFIPTLGFQFTQHLLKDGGRITRGRQIKIARNNLGISEEVFVARATDVVVAVLNAYWDLVGADEDIKVKEASRKLAQVVLEQNKIQAEVGTMAPLDVIQAEAEVATRTESLVVALHNKKLSEDQLKKLISSRIDPGSIEAEIQPLSQPDPPPPPSLDARQAIERAIEARPELRQLARDQENKRIQIDFTRNQLRPVLDLVAGYSQNGIGGDLVVRDYSKGIFDAPIIAYKYGGYWDAMGSMFNGKYLGYAAGITLRLPFGNDDARANSAQAQIDYRQGEERIRSQKQKVALEVRQAFDNIAMHRERVSTAAVTVRYQEKRLEGEQTKYSVGATTTRFILEAQRDLHDARTRLRQAKIDLIKGMIALEKATGQTFPAHSIELGKALEPFK